VYFVNNVYVWVVWIVYVVNNVYVWCVWCVYVVDKVYGGGCLGFVL